MMATIETNGKGAHDVYRFLKATAVGGSADIRWNFATKFLVARDGTTVQRFDGKDPNQLVDEIERLLLEDAPSVEVLKADL